MKLKEFGPPGGRASKIRHWDGVFQIFEDRFISTHKAGICWFVATPCVLEAEPSSDTDAELASERYFGKYCFLDQINQHFTIMILSVIILLEILREILVNPL